MPGNTTTSRRRCCSSNTSVRLHGAQVIEMAETTNPRAELPVDVFSIIERTCSVFSLLGSVLVIGTFCASKAFHKPINRLVFYASFGNLMTNAATLMARSFIANPRSAGCQFQGFLIQMYVFCGGRKGPYHSVADLSRQVHAR